MTKTIKYIAIALFGFFMLVNGIVGIISGKNTSHIRRQLGGRIVDGWPGYVLSTSDVAIGMGFILFLIFLSLGKSERIPLIIGLFGFILLVVGGIGSIFV